MAYGAYGYCNSSSSGFETRPSNEAKFVKALDKMEANIQHNEADLDSWTVFDREQVFKIDDFCEIDPYLQVMNDKIKQEAQNKCTCEKKDEK